jgi:apolipoprotein D and lipocalin family protein
VLKIDPDYRRARSAPRTHKCLWLLSRDPQVSAEVEAEYLAEAKRQGFQLDQWIRPEQSGRHVDDAQFGS